jgi:hypothetical protein
MRMASFTSLTRKPVCGSNSQLTSKPVAKAKPTSTPEASRLVAFDFTALELTAPSVEGSLPISRPGGLDEREADFAAERVLEGEALSAGSIMSASAAGSAVTASPMRFGAGRPLDAMTRGYLEPRFGADLSQVRVHDDADAHRSAVALDARAFTVRNHIAIRQGEKAGGTPGGMRLLAHELAHVLQQRRGGGAMVQRQPYGTPSPITVRSPLFEEAATQFTDVSASLSGRLLSPDEQDLVQPVFGASINFGQVRLLKSSILEFRTVGNTIRVPPNFSVANPEHAQTLVHEMTHVWQYQHGGTSYLSISLANQIAGTIRTGNRNAAYDYPVEAQASFFGFLPEQQATIVENYFSMLRDQSAPATGSFQSNHLDSTGFFATLSFTERQAQIARELPIHEKWIAQLRASMPQTEQDLVLQRASEVITTPGWALTSTPNDRSLTPIKPLLEIRF